MGVLEFRGSPVAYSPAAQVATHRITSFRWWPGRSSSRFFGWRRKTYLTRLSYKRPFLEFISSFAWILHQILNFVECCRSGCQSCMMSSFSFNVFVFPPVFVPPMFLSSRVGLVETSGLYGLSSSEANFVLQQSELQAWAENHAWTPQKCPPGYSILLSPGLLGGSA